MRNYVLLLGQGFGRDAAKLVEGSCIQKVVKMIRLKGLDVFNLVKRRQSRSKIFVFKHLRRYVKDLSFCVASEQGNHSQDWAERVGRVQLSLRNHIYSACSPMHALLLIEVYLIYNLMLV